MRRSSQIAVLALATAAVVPAAAQAQTPAAVLAQATPVTDAPMPRDGQRLTATPMAARDTTLMADAGDAKQLLAQAPTATATPPTSTLPRTGPELLLTLMAGGGMLLAGAGLRLQLRTGDGASATGAASLAGGAPLTGAVSLTGGASASAAVEPSGLR